MGQIILDKRGEKLGVDLRKGGPGAARKFHITLNWDDPAAGKKSGFLGFGAPKPVDLDLGCMYKLKDGEMGVIQPLGNNYGSKDSSPFIHLDKDDRSGAAADGENLSILKPELIEKLVIFALIYEGTANFSTVNGRMTIKDGGGTDILIRLDNKEPKLRLCAVALLEVRGEMLEIVKEERYFAGHDLCDRHYGFGFRWKAGSK
jgi:tellurite resistance protein TerA